MNTLTTLDVSLNVLHWGVFCLVHELIIALISLHHASWLVVLIGVVFHIFFNPLQKHFIRRGWLFFFIINTPFSYVHFVIHGGVFSAVLVFALSCLYVSLVMMNVRFLLSFSWTHSVSLIHFLISFMCDLMLCMEMSSDLHLLLQF